MGNAENFVDDSQSRHFWNVSRRDFLTRIIRQNLPGFLVNRYLDIGSGAGTTAARIAETVHAKQVCFSDINPLPGQLRLDLSRPIPSSTVPADWDLISALDVIEHIQDDAQALKNICTLLRPGGYALITVPANQKLFSAYDEYVRHYRRYSAEKLHQIGQQAGLMPITWNYFMALTYPLYLVGRARLQQRVKQAHAQNERIHILESARQSSPAFLNPFLRGLINLEAILNPFVRFPWGSSLYTIFQKPDKSKRTPPRSEK